MPYASDAQRAYMHIHHPEIAERWDEEMKDNSYGHNSRNFDADTYDRLDRESLSPFVSPEPYGAASITLAHDAAFVATTHDCTVQADGRVTTRRKAGPGSQGGDFSVTGGTP